MPLPTALGALGVCLNELASLQQAQPKLLPSRRPAARRAEHRAAKQSGQ